MRVNFENMLHSYYILIDVNRKPFKNSQIGFHFMKNYTYVLCIHTLIKMQICIGMKLYIWNLKSTNKYKTTMNYTHIKIKKITKLKHVLHIKAL